MNKTKQIDQMNQSLEIIFRNRLISDSGMIGFPYTRCSANCFAKKGAKEHPLVPMPLSMHTFSFWGCTPTKGLLSNVAGLIEAL
jgi:hypothetical protein